MILLGNFFIGMGFMRSVRPVGLPRCHTDLLVLDFSLGAILKNIRVVDLLVNLDFCITAGLSLGLVYDFRLLIRRVNSFIFAIHSTGVLIKVHL